jgi:hypothetical protein
MLDFIGKAAATFDLCLVFAILMLVIWPLLSLRLFRWLKVPQEHWSRALWFGVALFTAGIMWQVVFWAIDWIWRL